MGCYANPQGNKEAWLEVNATKKLGEEAPLWSEIPQGHLAVCLLHNFFFDAAAVAFDERELAVFADPDDERVRTWYIVSIGKLRLVAPLHEYLPAAAT